MAKRRPNRKRRPTPPLPSNRFLDKMNRHRTVSRILLAVIFPLLLLGLLEVGLRVSGFHYPTDFFLHVEKTDGFGTNRQFGWRFFPRAIARKPIPQAFPAEKGGRTCRVFVLGASAALGVPNSTFSFAQQLDVMLEARHPGVNFEVINTAITAINSHVVLPIAQGAARHDPDIFLVYLGNNEVIGPFGIGSARSTHPPSLETIRFLIGLRSTALGQALQSVGSLVSAGDPVDEEWGGMGQYTANMIGPNDPLLAQVHENYRQNLRDIVSAGVGAGARVVLSTVAVNIKDNPPFASKGDSLLAEPERTEFRIALTKGSGLQDQGHHDLALPFLQRAAELHPDHAEARFRLGQALLFGGDADRATPHLLAALEHDILRFRADGHRNRIVREVAEEFDGEGVLLADLDGYFRTHDPSGAGLPGAELFYEHVHLNFAGNHLAARALLPIVEEALPDGIRAARRVDIGIPSQTDVARALAHTPWNEYNDWGQIRTMIVHYPFTAQMGHEAFLAGLDNHLEILRSGATPEQARELLAAYDRAYRTRPDDFLVMINYVKLLNQTGNPDVAQRIFQRVLDSQPPPDDIESTDPRQMIGGG